MRRQRAAICVRAICRPLPDTGTTLKWRLSDAHNQYGILLATLPAGRHLSHDQQQLVDTLVEQLTGTLALDRHQERQQQLIVMRSAPLSPASSTTPSPSRSPV
ncbi:nitrate/nitrite sensor protein [Klebsiella michiganensis]|uniref:Nitrate/nitrite sensor protein n=1 Tax=Klebsiella michiganensis TaxID=1134687 RepID=A0A7H4PKX2_9ENTR|nr:nitrate/nitrite sensor protein [Klebsiella michiganensis]